MSAEMSGTMMRDWQLDVGFLTDVGLHRERNEDAYHVFLPYAGEENDTAVDAVFAVADGMGGYEGGDVAGRFVADAVERELAVTGARAPEDLDAWLRSFIPRVNRELCAVASARAVGRGMGSTLTMAVLRDDRIHLGHVGDSRCYRFRRGVLEQLTEDHSWVAQQVREGLLTPEEAENHPKRNMLTHCLGVEGDPAVFVANEPLEEGGRYLLCSDGLHGLVPDSVIAQALGEEATPQGAAARLVGLALEAGGHDNVTVLVFDANRASSMTSTVPGASAPRADALGGVVAGSSGIPEALRSIGRRARSLKPESALMLAGAVVIALTLTLSGVMALTGGGGAGGTTAQAAESAADSGASTMSGAAGTASSSTGVAATADSADPLAASERLEASASLPAVTAPTMDSLVTILESDSTPADDSATGTAEGAASGSEGAPETTAIRPDSTNVRTDSAAARPDSTATPPDTSGVRPDSTAAGPGSAEGWSDSPE